MTRGLIVLHPYATQIITGDKTEEYRDRPPPPGVIGSIIYLLSGGYALGRIKITWAEGCGGTRHIRREPAAAAAASPPLYVLHHADNCTGSGCGGGRLREAAEDLMMGALRLVREDYARRLAKSGRRVEATPTPHA
ncbi:MAG: ASCH domain-containing protein [Thaumarchaeota archaeon]|nr:ASCH domain-containing protein [Nitrososphaerota archaeon]